MSEHDDLSKIMDAMDNNKVTKIIPSPYHYYDPARNKFMKIISDNQARDVVDYSLLGLKSNDYGGIKPALIKLKSGVVALKIPYIELLRLFKE